MRRIPFFFLICLAGFSQGQIPRNMEIFQSSNGGYAPCEPSIAINPNNPAEMVAGAVLNYVATSKDSGKTWNTETLESQFGVYGDPCIIAGNNGEFYYFHLSDPSGEGWSNPSILDRIVCQKKKNINANWNKGYAPNPNGSKNQDKEWAAIHPTEDYIAMTWTEFDEYGSTDANCKSRILIAFSETGKKWSEPFTISETLGNCVDDYKTVEGAVPAFSPDGNLYVSWGGNGDIKFVKLDMTGWNFGKKASLAIGKEQTIVKGGANWDFKIPGIGRANGMPITMCDLSESETRGKIYINWADQRNGENDTDIWMISSSDEGKTWSEKVRVNQDNGPSHQFFTWSTIDQSNGNIYVVFYDRQKHTDNTTDVTLAVSKDGGLNFTNQFINQNSFLVPEGVFFGDYNNISAAKGVIRPIWTSVKNGKLVVMTALMND